MEGITSGVGMSLFQGSTQLQLDPNAGNELEEEAAADQQRRDEELQKLLTNAFDDLCDDLDDQSTLSSIPASDHYSNEGGREEITHDNIVARYHAAMFPEKVLLGNNGSNVYHYTETHLNNSTGSGIGSYVNTMNIPQNISSQDIKAGESTSVLHYQHCFRSSPGGRTSNEFPLSDNERYRQTGLGSAEQLQVLYEVRVREVERLSQQLETLAHEAACEKDELRRQVAFREAEKERAQLSYQQSQSLLIESKEKISKLEKHTLDLEAMVKSLESTRADLTAKLEASRLSVEDLHQKILLLERGNLNSTDKHLDTFLHNVQAMHTAQLKKMEDDLALALSRLNSKEAELAQLKQESQQRQHQLEARLAEKGDTVNQLARSLEEAQRQCQTLITQNSGQEVVHLRMKLSATEKECSTLTERLQDNQREIETLRSDIKQYEAFLKEELMDDTSDLESDSHLSAGKGRLHGELQRALMGLKLKREEISLLSSQLEARSLEVNQLKIQEEKNKLKLLDLQKDCQRHKDNMLEVSKHLEMQSAELIELKTKLSEEQDKAAKAIQEEEKQRIALESSQKKCQQLEEEVNTLKDKIELANGLHNCSEDNLRIHEEKFAQSLEELNKEYSAQLQIVRVELEQARKETDSVKEMYIKICNSKEEVSNNLQKEKCKVKELEGKLVQLKIEMEKLNQQSLKLEDLKAVQSLLDHEKERADELQEKNVLLLEKLEKGKDSLDAAQKAISHSVLLKEELLAKETDLKELRDHYNKELKETLLEKDKAVEELQKAKEMFAKKVTEEIEKAKTDALEELKRHRKEFPIENENKSKIKQYEEELSSLQERLQAAVRRHSEDTSALSQHLQEAKSREMRLSQALLQKEEELNKIKLLAQNAAESADKIENEAKYAFASKLTNVDSQHQKLLNEACEHVKEETMRFCVQQIRHTESKYLINIKNQKEEFEKEICKMRTSLLERESKLLECEDKLKETLCQLEKERLNHDSNNELKAKLASLEEELRDVEKKSEKTEKSLEVTKAKYQAAKKAVYKYKQYTEAQQMHLEKEWERINSGFQQTLNQVQQKLTKLVGQDNMPIV